MDIESTYKISGFSVQQKLTKKEAKKNHSNTQNVTKNIAHRYKLNRR